MPTFGGGQGVLLGERYISYLGPATDIRSSIDSFGIHGRFGVAVAAHEGCLEDSARLVVSGEGKRGPLGLRSSVGFAASVKPSKDPLGVNGPHVNRGIPDPTWGVFVPPTAHLTLKLSLAALVVSTQDVHFRCVTLGPHRVYFGMGLICLGPHFDDQRTSYIFTGCLVKDRLAGRVELEV